MTPSKMLHNEIIKTFPKLEAWLSENLILFLKTPTGELSRYRLGLGTMIRIKLVHEKTRLYKNFVRQGITEQDEMADIVIREFYRVYQHLLK